MSSSEEYDAAAISSALPAELATTVSAPAHLPEATVRRLTTYLRVLDQLVDEQATVSSQDLATFAGTNSATLRKDMSLLGTFGRRGVGYDVQRVRVLLETTLGLTREWRVLLVGAGNLGRAFAGYAGFRSHGFRFVGVIDSNPELVGTTINDLEVSAASDLEALATKHRANMAVLTVPGVAAQPVVDQLVAAGVHNILSFAPVPLRVPDGVTVRRVDVAREIQMLAYFAVMGEASDGT